MHDKNKKKVASELEVLDGLIDYAERMIYDMREGNYTSLRRHAYGKTVIIKSEKAGTLTFRLTSSSAIPNAKSNCATPHSPVGRLCAYLRAGDEDESPRWGEYRVIETRLFDRYDGPLFEPNVRNFLHMHVAGDLGKYAISNLRAYLEQMGSPEIPGPVPVSVPDFSEEEAQSATTEATDSQFVAPSPSINLNTFDIIEDEEDVSCVPLELDDDETDAGTIEGSTDKYFGLSETFYLNRTRDQDAVISRSPIGPMFVEGVAGSGKTSAALGRTKMLCDFNAQNVSDEKEFREITGHSLDYWSAKYAGQFSQESSVGFVRTGELIQYLKETCRRLDLPHLPVQEYPELRAQLRQCRQIERNRPGTKRWSGLPDSRNSQTDTSMAWLYAADRAIAACWSDALWSALPDAEAIAATFTPESLSRPLRVAVAAVELLRQEMTSLTSTLSGSTRSSGFLLDRLALRINECVNRVRKDIMGKDTLWVLLGDRTWFASSERRMAIQLIADKVPLYLRSQARLVFVDKTGSIDDSLTLLTDTGEPLTWCDETSILLDQGHVLVRDSDGHTVPARKSDEDDLFLRLLPETTEKLYVPQSGALRPLGLYRGLGKVRLPLMASAPDDIEDETDMDDVNLSQQQSAAESQKKQRSVDSVFSASVRRALLQPLTYLGDLYADALANNQKLFPDLALAQRIHEQLKERKLANEDIDLLLCLAHVIGREFNGKPSTLNEPPFYQSVFIDEVQDFTEQQVYLMVEQARREYQAVTVVGDIAQKLHNGHTIDILACFPGKSIPRVRLTENMRQLEAPALALFSACFRAELQDELIGEIPSNELAMSLREHADALRGPELLPVYDDEDLIEQVVETLRTTSPHQTLAVILPNVELAAAFYERCKPRLLELMVNAEVSQKIDLSRRHVRHFTSATHAKGLEFDVAIVPYLEQYNMEDLGHINRLYVALTRARRKLVLLSHESREESPFDKVWSRYEDTLASI
jgi:hypothetical protein